MGTYCYLIPEEEEQIYAKASRNEKYGQNCPLFVLRKCKVVPQGLLANIVVFESYNST